MIELRDVSKEFVSGKQVIHPVDDVSLTLRPGEFTVVVGPSGSGKTTLLSIVGMLLTPDSGDVLIDGESVRRVRGDSLARLRSRTIGFVFQDFNLLDYLTALENVRLARTLAGLPRADDACVALLEHVGLGERLHSRAHQLSGGEKQRVALCRALVNEPRVLLADEPTGNLDSHLGAEIIELMHRLVVERGMASMVVTHDPRLAERADAVWEMIDGRVARG